MPQPPRKPKSAVAGEAPKKRSGTTSKAKAPAGAKTVATPKSQPTKAALKVAPENKPPVKTVAVERVKAAPKGEPDIISVRGAREHNLRGIDIDLPRDRLVVITGLSGSGKSSLAFDTI